MPQDQRCIITLGINGPIPLNHPKVMFQDFPAGIGRLREDLRNVGFTGGFIPWDKEFPKGSPKQQDAHGAFKPFCFYEALKAGYTKVLWCDASTRVKRSVDPLFDLIRSEGYVIFQETHSAGEFCTDAALKPLGITREESFDIPSCWSCVLGLDLENERSVKFLQSWRDRAADGVTFVGPKWSGILGWPATASADPRVKGHRYDQTAASVIAFRLGMNVWQDRETFSSYFDNERQSVRRLQEWKSA